MKRRCALPGVWKCMASATDSIWLATTQRQQLAALQGTKRYDVVIVGAGIAGVSVAFALRKSGKKVALLEARRVLSDVTGHTTGKLTAQHGLIYAKTIQAFGAEKAQHYADANEWAVRFVEEISRLENIECDYVREPAHVFTTGSAKDAGFEEEVEACVQLGLPVSLVKANLSFAQVDAIRFDNQARFHPLKYLLGLLKLIEKSGIEIYENTRVREVTEKDGTCRIETENGEIESKHVVIATHYPIHDSGLFVTKLAPYKAYATAVEVDGFMPEGMFITEDPPNHSLRRQPYQGKDILIVGGEGHKVGQDDNADECFDRLEKWAKDAYNVKQVLFRWSTQDNWTPDSLPYIGRSPNRDNIYIATGFGGWGMTNGVAAGRMISEMIQGIENPWHGIFSPARLKWGSVPAIIKENINSASHLVGDKISKADYDDPNQVPIGEGAIVQMKDERLAVYRDETGRTRMVTCACTHWGCQVHWNSAEKTWDCPCHGSRFDIDGSVLHPPAVAPLEKRS